MLESTQFISIVLYIKYGPPMVVLDAVILEHAIVHAGVLALDTEGGFGGEGLENEVVIAVGAVLVGLLELLGVFPETLFTLLAGEGHVEGL